MTPLVLALFSDCLFRGRAHSIQVDAPSDIPDGYTAVGEDTEPSSEALGPRKPEDNLPPAIPPPRRRRAPKEPSSSS